jgi:hypothetical protein
LTLSLRKRVESATWLEFGLWFAASFAFNWWAFFTPSPWTRALAAGGGKLPESQFDFPDGEPQRSLDALAANNAIGDYLAWQAFDIPYAVLGFMVSVLAMALALKALRLAASPVRFVLLLPALYVVCEIAENSLVAAFAAGLVAPGAPVVGVQQTATAVKGVAGFGSMGLTLLSLVVAVAAVVARVVRAVRR